MKKLYPALGLAIAMALVSNPANAGGVADNAKPDAVAIALDTSPPNLAIPASMAIKDEVAFQSNEVAQNAAIAEKNQGVSDDFANSTVAGAFNGTATIGATAHEVACASLMSGDVVLRL